MTRASDESRHRTDYFLNRNSIAHTWPPRFPLKRGVKVPAAEPIFPILGLISSQQGRLQGLELACETLRSSGPDFQANTDLHSKEHSLCYGHLP